MPRRPAVIAYDISRNRIRRRVHRILLEWRLDGQKSVHECLLSTEEAKELFIQLSQAIDRDTDRLMLVWITPGRPIMARGMGRSDTFNIQTRRID
ncbi:MAG: CRISPR-associated endonuclease Cas2 [Candidatus Competibacteraceae bacterium]|nr:CRISPR-associated endonuclease Cas2 [Candidatus Competibacteraceae bacterium]MCB1805420.1 CRISPR-associated endonuclease Cas2 [Candidatus Competibacteraceae bacterium]MCB1811050.1 CRISPR-associated endonuclease Cas2 [Candidatus Competibacteraceae bacterium]